MTLFGHPVPFLIFFCLAEVLVISAVAFMGLYVGKYGGELNWGKNSGNYHPLFMTIGLIFCYTQGMLVFRFLRDLQKPVLKGIHAAIQGTAFIFVVFGLHAEFKNGAGIAHSAHSLHSWLGLGTVTLFACQLLCGFLAFSLPFLQLRFRAYYLPIHVFFGVSIFVMAVGTALMGVTEKIMFGGYQFLSKFQEKNTLLQAFGLCLVLLAITLVYAVGNPKFKRQPLMEERLVSNGSGIQTDNKMEAQVY